MQTEGAGQGQSAAAASGNNDGSIESNYLSGQHKRGRPLVSSLLLTVTAIIWGLAFVAQRVGMESIGPFMFVGLRMLLGAATLGLVVVFIQLVNSFRGRREAVVNPGFKRLLIPGALCGGVLFVAASLQQIGMVDTEASKAGFLTALYIVLVPIFGIAIRHKTHWNTWVSVLLASAGLYFLTIADSLVVQPGDAALLIGAVFWACHILVIDHLVAGLSQTEVMKLCVVQFAVAAGLAFLAAPFLDGFYNTDSFNIQAIINALPTVLYVGVLSTGVAFTLQAIGQQGLNPSAASIIMSMEAVFSVFGGMLLLQEMMTGREVVGCILMFVAVILSQLPVGRKGG